MVIYQLVAAQDTPEFALGKREFNDPTGKSAARIESQFLYDSPPVFFTFGDS